MKILLDECVTKKLKPLLKSHEVTTVSEMKWNGLKNGALLSEAAKNNYDVLLTIDKNIMHQQKVTDYLISIVVFDTESSSITELKKYVADFLNQLPSFEKRKVYVIKK